MSDDHDDLPSGGENPAVSSSPEEAAGAASPAPRPRATSAASRARRIGGRATPAPTPRSTGAVDAGTSGSDASTDPDRVDTSEVAVSSTVRPSLAKHSADAEAGSTDTDTETADAVSGSPAAPAARTITVPAWLRWLPTGVLGAGVIAMAVIMLMVSHGVWWGKPGGPSANATNAARDRVLAAAKTCLAAANTYKYTDLPAFRTAGLQCSTGKYTTEFTTAYTSLIQKYAPTLKASQTAQINKAGIESVSGGQWTLVLFGQLAVTNSNYPKGRTDPFAAEVKMTEVKGQWLISDLQTIASSTSS